MISTRDTYLLKKFGDRLRFLRKEKGISQEELAHRDDLQLSQIGRIERGEINTTISTAKVLSKALDVNMVELFNFKGKS